MSEESAAISRAGDSVRAREAISEILLTSDDPDVMLRSVCTQTARALPEADMVTITVLADGANLPMTTASTDGRSPPPRVPSVAQGIRSSASTPLSAGGRAIGALDVYTSNPHDRGEIDDDLVHLVSMAVEIAVCMTRRTATAEAMMHDLTEAVRSRAHIDRAVGIVMGSKGLSAAQAYATMTAVAQSSGVEVTDIAGLLITTVFDAPTAVANRSPGTCDALPRRSIPRTSLRRGPARNQG